MQPSAASAAGGTRPARILIVDDHEVSRAALRALLRTEGIDVADVRTAHAVITATVFRPDVAIVDLTPADPTGFRVAGQLQCCRMLPLSCSPPAPTGAASGPPRPLPVSRQGRPVRPDHHPAHRPART